MRGRPWSELRIGRGRLQKAVRSPCGPFSAMKRNCRQVNEMGSSAGFINHRLYQLHRWQLSRYRSIRNPRRHAMVPVKCQLYPSASGQRRLGSEKRRTEYFATVWSIFSLPEALERICCTCSTGRGHRMSHSLAAEKMIASNVRMTIEYINDLGASGPRSQPVDGE
jgi:hypothetical protein